VVASHTADVTSLVRHMMIKRGLYYNSLINCIKKRIDKKYPGYYGAGAPLAGTPAHTAMTIFDPSINVIHTDRTDYNNLKPSIVPDFSALATLMKSIKTQERKLEKSIDTLIDLLMKESILPYPRGLLVDAFLPDGSVQWYDMVHPKNKYRCILEIYTNDTGPYVEV
jgi:hypothetical protein